MYRILCDEVEIHNPNNNLYVLEPKLNLEVNDAGYLSFKLTKESLLYENITRKSIIKVFQDDLEIFVGYPVENEIDFYNRKKIYCEGQLSFLNDSIQRPAEYHDMTVRGYLETLINVHNQQVEDYKKFTVGMVTVTDSNDSLYRYTNWENTLTAIKEDLINSLGGYLRIRNQDNKHYLDYLVDYNNTNTQHIKFGENLLDFVKDADTSDIATGVIPLGAKLEESSIDALEERLTIKSVNNDIDYLLNTDAANLYGKIFKVVTWDDVHDPLILKNKAEAYLRETQWENTVIEVKAVDLYYTDANIEKFKLGDDIRITSIPHGLDKNFPLTKMEIDLVDISKNVFTLGTTVRKTLTSDTSSNNSEILNKIEQMPTTQSVQQIVDSAIDNSTEIILNSLNGFVSISKNEILIMDTDNKETAKKVWRWNSGGLGYSKTGYNGTYETAITMDGTIVGQMIAANSIYGTAINANGLKVKDGDKTTLQIVDGKVYISAESLSIGGEPVIDIIGKEINDFAKVVTQDIDNLQNQLDGQIETWFYNYIPDLNNLPASLWVTNEEKEKHLKDLFYVIDNEESGGLVYRFVKNNSTYKWELIEDTEIAKALAIAAKAQDTADGKRRTFLNQPTPPYDSGDVWMQGENGDILTCIVSRETGNFIASDWKKCNKYTDDSKAIEALDEAKKARTMNVVLSNEYQGIPVDSNGNYTSFPETQINVMVFYGSVDITNKSDIEITKSNGITGIWDAVTHTYTITGLTSDTGNIDFKATYLEISTIKKFNISKIRAGQQGLRGLQGEQGERGIPGKDGSNGTNGQTSYFHVKYSEISNPTSSSQMTESPSTYIGTYVDFVQSDSTDPYRYTWSRFQGLQGEQGERGIPGTNGENGQTYYLHIKYSNDGGKTFTSNNGEIPGSYIGVYTDTVASDSNNVSVYTWSQIKGKDGSDGTDGRIYFLECNPLVIRQSANNVFSPKNIVFSSFYRIGSSATRTAYAGRYKIYESTDGSVFSLKFTSTVNESSCTYTPSNTAVKAIRCEMYAAGGTTSMLDRQTVVVVKDVDNLTQAQIFNILTNGGIEQGLYIKDGKIYLNATYIGVTDWSETGKTLSGFRVSTKRLYGQSKVGDTTYCNGMSTGGDDVYCLWAGETNGHLGDGNTDAPFWVSRDGRVKADRLYAGNCLDLYETSASWKGNQINVFRNDCTLNVKQNHHRYGDLRVVLHPWDGETQLVFNWCSKNHGTVYLYGGYYDSETYVGLYHSEYNNNKGGAVWRYQTDGKFHIVVPCVFEAGYSSASLEKYKTNIEKVSNEECLALIDAVDVYKYNLKSELEIGRNKKQYGFIIDRECPKEFTNCDETGIDGYTQGSINTGAIKALLKRVETLENEVEQLKRRG